MTAPQFENLQSSIPAWLAEFNVPGLSLAVIEQARLTWQAAFGLKDLATGQPVTTDTVFQACSLTKPVFSYAVLKLAGQGRLDLDRPLVRYIDRPYWRRKLGAPDDLTLTDLQDERLQKLTARHVLSHTTGWPNWRPFGRPLRFHFAPGDRFAYSGEGFMALQLVVEHLTGQPLDRYLRLNLLDPLGMETSSFSWRDEYASLAATGYDPAGRPVENDPLMGRGRPAFGTAAGSLRTTPGEYARFVMSILQAGAEDEYRLGRPVVDRMLEPQIKLRSELSWGLGWGIQHLPSGDISWHWGSDPGFEALVMFSQVRQSGLVIFTNSSSGQAVIHRIAEALFGPDLPAYTLFLDHIEDYLIFN